LALLVQEMLKRDPHGGHLIVFRGRSGGLIKVLWRDARGSACSPSAWSAAASIWPSPVDGTGAITPAQARFDRRHPPQTWRPEAAG